MARKCPMIGLVTTHRQHGAHPPAGRARTLPADLRVPHSVPRVSKARFPLRAGLEAEPWGQAVGSATLTPLRLRAPGLGVGCTVVFYVRSLSVPHRPGLPPWRLP